MTLSSERRAAVRRIPTDFEQALRLPHSAIERLGATMMSALSGKFVLSNAALNALHCGVMLVDEAGHVLLSNERAETMLRCADGVALCDGRLILPHGNNQRLHELLGDGLRSRALRAPRRGGSDYLLTLSPVDGPEHLQIGQVTLLLVDDLDAPLPDQPHLLADLFQLTPAQARMAWCLASGATPKDCAKQLNVSLPTVKAHMRELFVKTQTHRQSDLVRLISRVLRSAS